LSFLQQQWEWRLASDRNPLQGFSSNLLYSEPSKQERLFYYLKLLKEE
jgi:hypothetical protein